MELLATPAKEAAIYLGFWNRTSGREKRSDPKGKRAKMIPDKKSSQKHSRKQFPTHVYSVKIAAFNDVRGS